MATKKVSSCYLLWISGTYSLHSLQNTAGDIDLGRGLFDLSRQVYDEPYLSAVGEVERLDKQP